MPIEIKSQRKIRPTALSFRFSEEAINQIEVLAMASNQPKVHVLEQAIRDAFEEFKKSHPDKVREAHRKILRK